MRRITCKALDGSVRRAAKARQDPIDKRWYLPLTDKEVGIHSPSMHNNTTFLFSHYTCSRNLKNNSYSRISMISRE